MGVLCCVCVYIMYDKYGHHYVSISRYLDIDIDSISLVNQSNCSNLHRPRARCRAPRAFDR